MSGSAAGVWGQNLPLYIAELQFRYDARFTDNFRTTIETTCEIQMKKPAVNPTEQKCAACNGTGFAVVAQPAQPDRKIYPPRCQECEGKGRIAGAAN